MTITIPDFPTSFTVPAFRATAPDGWLILNGQTIGSASSGASARASADTEALFLILWNDTNAEVVGGRGTTAASDFEANKELVLPDTRKRGIAGKSNDEGWDVLGAVLGSETHSLSLAEIPNHEHSLNNSGTFDTGGATTSNAVPADKSGGASNVDPIVLGAPHNNVQPTIIANWMIKL